MNSLFLEKMVDSLSDALITIDQNSKIIVWNEMARTIFGYEIEEIQHMGLDAIIPPAYRQRHQEAYDLFINSIENKSSHVSRIRQFEGLRKNGERFPIELTHSFLKVSDKEFYITAIVRDVSLRKRYEIVRGTLERITRHDLKNKLSIISLAAKRLAPIFDNLESQAAKYLEIIQSESRGSVELLDSTRELILLETGEYKRKDRTVDLAGLVALKTEHIQPMAAAKRVMITFRNDISRKVTLQADESLLERAFENLIKNAVEAENPSGMVELILKENEEGVPILEIHNGGKRIPEDVQKLLFSPYVTHGKKGGVGLGLYSSKLILETIHGWQISFHSGTQGTVFRVTFGPRES